MTKSLEYRKCLETGETTKSLDIPTLKVSRNKRNKNKKAKSLEYGRERGTDYTKHLETGK